MNAAADQSPRTPSTDVRVLHTLAAVRSAFLELLEVRDARSISISQLCKKASISRPTFYQHYSGLDDVYADIVRQELARTAREFETFADPPGHDPLEQLLSFVHHHRGGNILRLGDGQLASHVRPIVELWLAERVARAVFAADLESLQPDQRLRTHFVTGGLMTVLNQQMDTSPKQGEEPGGAARTLRCAMEAVLHEAA